MRIVYALLAPLLLLGGCATSSMADQAPPMADCPMASGAAGGDQHGAMMDKQGGMMGQSQMSPEQKRDKHHDMANCPMVGKSMPGAAPGPAPANPHQH